MGTQSILGTPLFSADVFQWARFRNAISRLLGDTDDSWKVIPNVYFSDYSGLQFLLKCNYNSESINTCLPNFY